MALRRCHASRRCARDCSSARGCRAPRQAIAGRGRRAAAASSSGSSSKRNCRRPKGNISISRTSGAKLAKRTAAQTAARAPGIVDRPPAVIDETAETAYRRHGRRQLDQLAPRRYPATAPASPPETNATSSPPPARSRARSRRRGADGRCPADAGRRSRTRGRHAAAPASLLPAAAGSALAPKRLPSRSSANSVQAIIGQPSGGFPLAWSSRWPGRRCARMTPLWVMAKWLPPSCASRRQPGPQPLLHLARALAAGRPQIEAPGLHSAICRPWRGRRSLKRFAFPFAEAHLHQPRLDGDIGPFRQRFAQAARRSPAPARSGLDNQR